MGNYNVYCHKKPFIILVIFLILFINIALSQNKWIKVEIPSQNLNSFIEYDENYFIMPQDLFRKGTSKKGDMIIEISLPNEMWQRRSFSKLPIPLLNEKLSKKYSGIKTFKGKSKVQDVEVRLSTQQAGINA